MMKFMKFVKRQTGCWARKCCAIDIDILKRKEGFSMKTLIIAAIVVVVVIVVVVAVIKNKKK